MDLTVITVTWNSAKYILSQMRSVENHCAGLTWEQIVVDNASSDCGISVSKSDNFRLIQNVSNLGFAKANNQGAKIASGDYFLFLNPDMEITSDIKLLLNWWKTQPRLGIVGGKLLYENGEINLNAAPRRFPTILNQLLVFLKIPHIFPSILNHYLYRDIEFNQIQPVDTVRGSFMFIRRDVYQKLGYAFDERFFAWFEDVDICRSARQLGYDVVYFPGVTAIDHVGRSFSRRSIWWRQWTFFKSAYLYFRKWQLN